MTPERTGTTRTTVDFAKTTVDLAKMGDWFLYENDSASRARRVTRTRMTRALTLRTRAETSKRRREPPTLRTSRRARHRHMLARFSATSTSSLLRRGSRAVSAAQRRAFPPLRRARVPSSPDRASPLVTMASAGARLDKVATPCDTAVADVSATGAFVRKDSTSRTRIEKDGPSPPEAGRYHVYVSLACPWACRVVSTIGLKGLGDVISWSSVHPTWQKTR